MKSFSARTGPIAGHWIAVIFCLVALITLPSLSLAQTTTKPVLGVLSPFIDAESTFLKDLRDGLDELGFRDGRNITIEYRSAEGDFQRLPELAAELVTLKVDVIVAERTQASLAAKKATATIPIVFLGVSDPVGSGLVSSLGRPGGNVTGISNLARDLSGKQVQLLIELLPQVRRVGIIANLANPGARLQLTETERIIREVGRHSQTINARSSEEFESAFKRLGCECTSRNNSTPSAWPTPSSSRSSRG